MVAYCCSASIANQAGIGTNTFTIPDPVLLDGYTSPSPTEMKPKIKMLNKNGRNLETDLTKKIIRRPIGWTSSPSLQLNTLAAHQQQLNSDVQFHRPFS